MITDNKTPTFGDINWQDMLKSQRKKDVKGKEDVLQS